MQTSHMVRLYPNASQMRTIDATIDCARWVYNEALASRKEAHSKGAKAPSCNDLVKMIPGWKKDRPWLAEADSMALQQAVRDLDRAYANFFREPGKVGFPRFKSKHAARASYRTNNSSSGKAVAILDRRHVKLPKLGTVKARVSMEVPGRIVSATVSRTPTGKYLVSLLCEEPEPARAPAPASAPEMTGVDMGVKNLVTTSEGVKYANPKAGAKFAKKLAREQRRLSRKKRGSKNRERQRVKVARVSERIADARRDALHKATTDVVRESQAVAVEDLSVKGMQKTRRLSRVVADASMGSALRMLEYKCARQGRPYVKVGRFFPSSKTCSSCGHVLEEMHLSVRSWECPACGAAHDRDVNAARNIAAEGLRILKESGTAGLAGTAAAR